MSNLCIIPARGGSKRIPRKNIRSFLGKPMLAYAIETALNTGLFDEVMVSTDDDEIAETALRHGAQVPFRRSTETAGDHATTFDAIKETIDRYQTRGAQFTYACCIYPCTPLLSADKVQEAFRILTLENRDSVFPVTVYSPPIQRALAFDEAGRIAMRQPEYLHTRTQDLEKTYHDSGQFYFFHVETILKKQKLFTENSGAILVDEMDTQDIDNMADWELAEFKYTKKYH